MFIPANPTISFLNKKYSVLDIAGSFPFKVSVVYPSARTALQSVLKKKGAGKTIWLPAFMCKSLLKPIQSCGLNINYYDIDEQFMPKLSHIKISKGDYVLVVHFFGILINLEKIKKLCLENEFILIEDCAHILPDTYAAYFAGKFGDISIFSFRKILPVLYGGIITRGYELNKKDSFCIPIIRTSIKKKLLTIIERVAFIFGINILLLKKKLRSIFGNTDTSTLSGEQNSVLYAKKDYTHNNNDSYLINVINKRKENYKQLSNQLMNFDKISMIFPNLPDGSCPQFFPILVKNKQVIFDELIKFGIEAIIWPGEEKLEILLDDYPGTALFDKNLLLLPIHHDLTKVHIRYIAENLIKVVLNSN